MKASVLAIGTELTTGQITNRNSSWISSKLKKHGLLTELHLTVPDDRALNLESLKLCAQKSDVIFITGGLGPTSDDFTRDVVAEWSGLEMQFDAASWKHIEDRLLPRGIPVKEIQRQQCFFPKTAKILTNQAGTANGFYLTYQGKEVFVLPGPPREIESIWNDHIQAWLVEKTKDLDPQLTLSWDILGWPESQVAEAVMKLFSELKTKKELSEKTFSELELGYRVHLPYVEFKLSFAKSRKPELQQVIAGLDLAFGPAAVAKNGHDILQAFAKSLANHKEIHIQDLVTESYLLTRIEPAFRKLASEFKWTLSNNLESASTTALQLQILPINEHEVRLVCTKQGQNHYEDVKALNTSALMRERRQQFFAECALLFWTKILSR